MMSGADRSRAVADAMISMWESEIPATLRVLAAVPDEQRDYRPAPKSRSAWELATHIATADLWFIQSIERGVFQFDLEQARRSAASFSRIDDVVAFYRDNIPARLQRLRDLSGDKLAEPIEFGGMKQSRAAWIGFANNHGMHHRGQLSAYLRSMGSRVPDIYGPSGDADSAA